MKRKNLWTPYKIWNETDWYQNLDRIKKIERRKRDRKEARLLPLMI